MWLPTPARRSGPGSRPGSKSCLTCRRKCSRRANAATPGKASRCFAPASRTRSQAEMSAPSRSPAAPAANGATCEGNDPLLRFPDAVALGQAVGVAQEILLAPAAARGGPVVLGGFGDLDLFLRTGEVRRGLRLERAAVRIHQRGVHGGASEAERQENRAGHVLPPAPS